MKKTPFVLLLVAMMLTFSSYTPMGSTSALGYNSADTTKTSKDKSKPDKIAPQDTSVAYTDTLGEVSVKANKELRVVDAINKSLHNNGITQPGKKSVSDIIGSKATDYIMHPFAWKERKKEKKQKKVKESLIKLDAAKTYEEELAETIYRQLQEDSIAAAKKKQEAKK